MRFFVFFLFLITFILGFSFDAGALSCMRPDIYRTFEDKKKSEDVYMLVRGIFTELADKGDGDVKPEQKESLFDGRRLPAPQTVLMMFQGTMIGDKPEHDRPLDNLVVEVKTFCAAHWCGSLPAFDKEVITFLQKRDDDAPLLVMHACGGNVFLGGGFDSVLDDLRDCFRDDCSMRHHPEIVPR